jgi:hypothetical protein
MAEKTIVEKVGEKVGFGMAMASDVAGSIKTVFDTTVGKVTEVLKKAPEVKTEVKKAAKKAPGKKAAKKSVAKKAVKKIPAKKAAKKVSAKKIPAKKAPTKSAKTATRRH